MELGLLVAIWSHLPQLIFFLFPLVEKAINFLRKVWLQYHSSQVYDILSKKQS
jgi:hypothetical protein